MDHYSEETFGELAAEDFDNWQTECDPRMIRALCELSQGGRALELGIGTGRVALPLKQSGVDISGVDNSPEMVAKLRAKPAGTDIPVHFGSFAEVMGEAEYNLIFVVDNTIFGLLTQEEQVRCFQNAARHLAPEGSFLVEASVPDMKRFQDNQSVRVTQIDIDQVHMDVMQLDQSKQQLTWQKIVLSESGTKLFPVMVRYVWPSELDLMAALAGMRLKERWGGWDRSPFTAESNNHISIYGR